LMPACPMRSLMQGSYSLWISAAVITGKSDVIVITGELDVTVITGELDVTEITGESDVQGLAGTRIGMSA